MKRRPCTLALVIVVLYAALAGGAANCLVLHAEQPQPHHHGQSHMAHSALCAWACQIHPTFIVAAPIPLGSVSTVVAKFLQGEPTTSTTLLASLLTSRAPPLS